MIAQNDAADPGEARLRDAYERLKGAPPDSPQFAKGFRDLAEYYSASSRYTDAEKVLSQLLEEREHAFGLNSSDILTELMDLGRVNFAQMKYGIADGHYRRALQIAEGNSGKQSLAAATVRETLARVLDAQDKPADAADQLRRALAIREKVQGAEDPALVPVLTDLAELERRLSRLDPAERNWQLALRIEEKRGPYAIELAPPLEGLARLSIARKDYAQAETLLRRALSIRESVLGPMDPEVAEALSRLGAVYMEQKRYEPAARVLERALFIDTKAYGNDHPATRMTLMRVAEVYGKQGKAAESEPLFRQMLESQEMETARSLRGLAGLCAQKNRHAEAETLFRNAISLLDTRGWVTARKPVIRADDPPPALLVETLEEYAAMQRARGKKAEATRLEARARLLSPKNDVKRR